MVSTSSTISCGIYVIRRRQLIELIERCAAEDRVDFVRDILVRYKNLKRIYAYKLNSYWSNIASVESYYKTNMDFLKPEVRNYFFKEYPDVYSKVDDLPPAKYNPGALVKNSLISSGSIINGTVENSILFKKAYVGNNCVIKNSIILNDVYIGDNTVIENCIVESRDTIRANTTSAIPCNGSGRTATGRHRFDIMKTDRADRDRPSGFFRTASSKRGRGSTCR